MAAMKRLLPLLCALLPLAVAAAELPLHLIKLPPGFAIELFARVDNARGMALGAQNTLFVGSMRAGKVHALKFDARYRVTRSHLVAEGLQLPVGVAFRDGALYVSAVSRILRFDGIENRLAQSPYSPPPPAVVRDDFPRETHHGWKFIAFGPDGRLYVPVGAPCNICAPDPERYANILRMNPDGSNPEVFARGVRNTVGFAWHPGDRRAVVYRQRPRPAGRRRAARRTQPRAACRPALRLSLLPRRHAGRSRVRREAALRRFRAAGAEPRRRMSPRSACASTTARCSRRNTAGRSSSPSTARGTGRRRSGYRVSLVRLRDGKAVAYEPFAEGWLQGESAWGRPADLLVLPDGSLLVSDDHAGAIYRITHARP
jgi:glucose/arabinose dehydrogenase